MAMIYESPDGGRTVYERVSGKQRRRLISHDPDIDHFSKRRQLWDLVLLQSMADPELRHMVEQVEVYYTLRYTKSHD